MIRMLFSLASLLALVIMLAEFAGVAFLYFQGKLTADTLEEINLALSQSKQVSADDDAAAAKPAVPGSDAVVEKRMLRVLAMEARESELNSLKSLATDSANQLIQDRQAFDEMRARFQKELTAMDAEMTSASQEQTRGILLALETEDAVQRLMGLPPEVCVELLRGMTEKNAARLLSGFTRDAAQMERAQQIFEAIQRGEPQRSALNRAQQALPP